MVAVVLVAKVDDDSEAVTGLFGVLSAGVDDEGTVLRGKDWEGTEYDTRV